MQVRALTHEDAAAFWALRLRAFREEPAAFGWSYDEVAHLSVEEGLRTVGDVIRGPSDVVLGAFDGPNLSGIAGLEREKRKKRAHRAKIWGVYVAPEARGRGLAKRLLQGLIDHATEAGIGRLHLSVIATNTAALRLYQSLGFQTFGEERDALRVEGRSYGEYFLSLAVTG